MDRKQLRRFLLGFFIGASIGVVILYGCEKMDKAVTDVNTVASAAKTIIESPAGQLVPPDWRLYGGLTTALLMAGAAAYKQWRLSQMSKTAKAIVQGVEASEKQQQGDNNPANSIKTAIAAEMRKAHIYDVGNKLVDRLKLS